VFDHAKLILKYLQDHWQRNNYIFAIASRAWRLIYTYSHCNLCTVNADGLRLKQSHWISFEVCRQQSGNTDLAATTSLGIYWLSGMWPTMSSGNAIRGATKLPLALCGYTQWPILMLHFHRLLGFPSGDFPGFTTKSLYVFLHSTLLATGQTYRL